jgi:hypothetical protein
MLNWPFGLVNATVCGMPEQILWIAMLAGGGEPSSITTRPDKKTGVGGNVGLGLLV